MEKSEQKNKLESLKAQAQEIINQYNTLSADEKISLTDTSKNQSDKNVEPEKVDVSNYYLCSYGTEHIWVGRYFTGHLDYDFDSVGLFERLHDFHTKLEHNGGGFYFLGQFVPNRSFKVGINHLIYKGIDSDQIAIYELTDDGQKAKNPGYTASLSDGRHVSATCVIDKYYNFDRIRAKMYQDGEIDLYEVGKATSEEISKVLVYANKLLCGDTAKQNKKQS